MKELVFVSVIGVVLVLMTFWHLDTPDAILEFKESDENISKS